MSWLASIAVALVTGVAGLLLAGFVANACVAWYRISSFEGKSGYFVAAIALLGGVLGLVLGVVVARAVGGGGWSGAAQALAIACGIAVLLAAFAATSCRLLADVPPRLGGDELMLEVELRLPAGETIPAAGGPRPSVLRLGSVARGRRRAVRDGALALGDARQIDGRWRIPGSVFLFTGRGMRLLETEIDGAEREGFLVPLPARPRPAHEDWSDWLPRAMPGGPEWPESRLSYRFRVQRIAKPPAEAVAAG